MITPMQHLEKTFGLFRSLVVTVKTSQRSQVTEATDAVLRRITSLLRKNAQEPPVGATLLTLSTIIPNTTEGESFGILVEVHPVLLELVKTTASSKTKTQIFGILKQLVYVSQIFFFLSLLFHEADDL
jgi:hypothetical protein